MIEQARQFDIQLTQGSLFKANGQETPWLRFNAAHLDKEEFWNFLEQYRQK